MDASRTLLEGIVDYAGLFPPTSASMPDAVAEYARQSRSGERWMLGSFVVDVGRLDALASAVAALAPESGPETWPLSVLATGDGEASLDSLERFLAGAGSLWRLDAIEWKPPAPEMIARFADRAPSVEIFCELPWDLDLDPWLGALAAAGKKAKIRCGGVRPELIPGCDRVAGFLRACHAARVGMKFTAGLHHPVRSMHRLTYETDAPTAMMHGFLNVFVAAALVAAGEVSDLTLLAVLEETDAAAFSVGVGGVAWREHQVDLATLERARGNFARSFGSCSFAEPVEDLHTLGIL